MAMKGIMTQGPPTLPSKDTPTKDITLGWWKCCIFKISSTRFCTSPAVVKIPEEQEEEDGGRRGRRREREGERGRRRKWEKTGKRKSLERGDGGSEHTAISY